MTEKTEYAVLQFVEQNGYCHMVHAVIQGHSVMEYAKEEVKLDKSKVSGLLISLVRQLEQFYKCEEQEAYGFVNPYAIIVTEDGEVRLLDTEAQENRELLVKMQKKKVRVLFISPEYVLSQRKRREDDLYGFGKSVQFVVDKCCGQKAFSWREEKLFQKLYARCRTGGKASIDEWKSMGKILQKLDRKESGYFPLKAGTVFLLCLTMLVLGLFMGKVLFEDVESVSAKEALVEKQNQENAQMQERLQALEDDLKVSEEKLRLSEQYGEMLELVGKDSLNEEECKKLEADLEELSAAQKEKMMSEEGRMWAAAVYEKLERYDAAIVEYEEIRRTVEDLQKRKEIYLKLLNLYERMDLPEKVTQMWTEAMAEMPELAEDEAFAAYKPEETEKTIETEETGG